MALRAGRFDACARLLAHSANQKTPLPQRTLGGPLLVKVSVELSSFFVVARTRRTHNAAQRGPHPDHPHRQPAAPGGADGALCPPLARRGGRRRELDRVGKAAVHEVVAKQIAAGIDVGNNGEQQREAFFLYVRHRMSGFGGGWTRRVLADATHYPAFKAWKAAHDAVNESISNLAASPRRSARSAIWIARRSRPNARISAPRSTRRAAVSSNRS